MAYNMKLLKYYQILGLLNFVLSPNFWITLSVCTWKTDGLASTTSITFTLGMYDASYILTANISCWVFLLISLVRWDSLNIYVWVNLFKDSSGLIYFVRIFGSSVWSDIDWAPRVLLGSKSGSPFGLQLIVYIPPWSKVIYHNLVGSTL